MSPESIEALKHGAVGVIPTDTIYGIVASALNKEAVEKIYAAKGRDPQKACIILIHDLKDIEEVFCISLSDKQRAFLETVWPKQVSVIIPTTSPEFEYLSRGTGGLSFRIPLDEDLLDALKKCGPIVAPSANPEGEEPAVSVDEAQGYFGDTADFYEDGGVLNSEPSTIIRLTEGGFEIVREGAVKL